MKLPVFNEDRIQLLHYNECIGWSLNILRKKKHIVQPKVLDVKIKKKDVTLVC